MDKMFGTIYTATPSHKINTHPKLILLNIVQRKINVTGPWGKYEYSIPFHTGRNAVLQNLASLFPAIYFLSNGVEIP